MKIGIIGGSSQVGSSVAYYLKKYTGFEVVCFIRSLYSKNYFDFLHIHSEYLDLNNRADIKEKLKDCSIVIDFTLPSGELFSIPGSIDTITGNIISSLSGNQKYIYMSSIMAYGMPPAEKNIKSYLIPRSSYAFIKRKAERRTLELGRKYKVKTYNFRLGQVHGFLQSVNTSFREKLHQNNIVFIDGKETDVTNTVFISSIAEAIIKFSKEDQVQGTYTLVSNPQWTLKQLYTYYVDFYNIETTLQFVDTQDSIRKRFININSILSSLKKYRPLLETYVLMRTPSLSLKIKGKYRENEIRQIRNGNKEIAFLDLNLLGVPDKKIISNINSDYNTVFKLEKEMDHNYSELVISNRK